MIDDSGSKTKLQESNQNTLRESNTPKMSVEQSRKTNNFNFAENHDNTLFTDPKLLNLIHSDL